MDPPILTGAFIRPPPIPPDPPDPTFTSDFPPLPSSRTTPSGSSSPFLVHKETIVAAQSSTISSPTTLSAGQLLASYLYLPTKAPQTTIVPPKNSRSGNTIVSNSSTVPNPTSVPKITSQSPGFPKPSSCHPSPTTIPAKSGLIGFPP